MTARVVELLVILVDDTSADTTAAEAFVGPAGPTLGPLVQDAVDRARGCEAIGDQATERLEAELGFERGRIERLANERGAIGAAERKLVGLVAPAAVQLGFDEAFGSCVSSEALRIEHSVMFELRTIALDALLLFGRALDALDVAIQAAPVGPERTAAESAQTLLVSVGTRLGVGTNPAERATPFNTFTWPRLQSGTEDP